MCLRMMSEIDLYLFCPTAHVAIAGPTGLHPQGAELSMAHQSAPIV